MKIKKIYLKNSLNPYRVHRYFIEIKKTFVKALHEIQACNRARWTTDRIAKD